MEVIDNKVFIGCNDGFLKRMRKGIYVFDLSSLTFEFIPVSSGNFYNASITAIFRSAANTIYCGYNDPALTPAQNYIGRILRDGTYGVFISDELGESDNRLKKAEGIILDMSFHIKNSDAYSNPAWSIKAKLYNFTRNLWCYAVVSVAGTATNKITVDGTRRAAYGEGLVEAGDEIVISDGVNAGLTRHISSISGEATATEIWTLDSALTSNIEKNVVISCSPFKLVGTKSLAINEMPDDRLYIPITNGMKGRRFLVKLIISRTNNKPDIKGFSFVYNNLGLK
jgi:hypothetical protein